MDVIINHTPPDGGAEPATRTGALVGRAQGTVDRL
jgi:hypothetical protein